MSTNTIIDDGLCNVGIPQISKPTHDQLLTLSRLCKSYEALDIYAAFMRHEQDLIYYFVGEEGDLPGDITVVYTAISEAFETREEAVEAKKLMLAEHPTARVVSHDWHL